MTNNRNASMRERGFLMPPSLEEPLFLSAAHTNDHFEAFAAALGASIRMAMPVLAS